MKSVRFDDYKNAIWMMCVWNYAYRATRCGTCEQMVRDRERFKLRIARTATIINPVLLYKFNKYLENKSS